MRYTIARRHPGFIFFVDVLFSRTLAYYVRLQPCMLKHNIWRKVAGFTIHFPSSLHEYSREKDKCSRRMSDLEVLVGGGFSPYLLRKLQRKCITTAHQFLEAATGDLIEITGLPEKSIIEARQRLCEIYGPRQESLLEYANQRKWAPYETGIPQLDQLMRGDPFAPGSVWEICGAAGVGKTQFCHTVALNFALQHDAGVVLYIDTKYDFCGSRILEMLRSRDVEKAKSGRVMQQIVVERTLSAEGVIDILDQLLLRLAAQSADVAAVKLVVLDALPAVWLLFQSDTDRVTGKYLLETLACRVHKLAQEYHMAVVMVNLLVYAEEESIKQSLQPASADNLDDAESDHGANDTDDGNGMRPTLGHYWTRVPRLRLALELPKENNDCTLRIVRVLKSCYTAEGGTCDVRITAAGII